MLVPGTSAPPPPVLAPQRARVVEAIWAEHGKAIADLRAAGVGAETRALHPFDAGRTELAARVRELADAESLDRAEADCRHVLAVAVAEARASGTQRYLDGGLWKLERFGVLLRRTVDDAKQPRAGPRGTPTQKPEPPPRRLRTL